jgi:hypothetical protein
MILSEAIDIVYSPQRPGGHFFKCYIFQEAVRINTEDSDHRSAEPSISFAPGSPIYHPLGKALLSPAS